MWRFAVALAGLLLVSPARAEPTEYQVDNAQSLIFALVYKAGAASAIAHDHFVHAKKISGSATHDPDDPGNNEISISINVLDLFPDEPDMRDRVGLHNNLSDGQREEIRTHILAKYQLWADEFPAITFESTSFSGSSGKVDVTGSFSLRGVSKTITVPMNVKETPNGINATGQFRLTQSDFGYKPYSALFGALKVKDGVDIVLNVNLTPK